MTDAELSTLRLRRQKLLELYQNPEGDEQRLFVAEELRAVTEALKAAREPVKPKSRIRGNPRRGFAPTTPIRDGRAAAAGRDE